MRLSVSRFLKVLFSSLFLQTSWSFFSMQSLGFLYTLIAGARQKQKQDIIDAHKELFNTHPYMSSYIIGATLRAHDDKTIPHEKMQRFITVAQTSFASAGDLLFWRTLRPTLLILAVVLGVHFGVIGPIMFLIIYNIFHLYHRIQGINDGYRLGPDTIFLLKARRFGGVQQVFEMCGAFATGFLLSLVSLKPLYLLVVPLSILFLILLLRRFSSVLIAIVVGLLIIMLTMVYI